MVSLLPEAKSMIYSVVAALAKSVDKLPPSLTIFDQTTAEQFFFRSCCDVYAVQGNPTNV